MVIKSSSTHIKKIGIIGVIILIISVCGAVILFSTRSAAPPGLHEVRNNSFKPSFNKTHYSLADPASLWVVVNKHHPLAPVNYTPGDLASLNGVPVSQKLAPSLNSLITDAKNQKLTLKIISGYRSYGYQTNLYNSYVSKDGQAAADTYSARPGYSEHQTGLAVDLGGAHGCDLEACFGETPEGKWLAENAYKYGFIIRYPAGKQAITGYEAEPWHLRFVGSDLAGTMKRQKIATLEEFFNVTEL